MVKAGQNVFLSNVAGKGSRQHDFCTTEREISDNSRFEVGEKLLSSQLVVEICSEEKKSGISEGGAIQQGRVEYFFFIKNAPKKEKTKLKNA